jgi:uncharacterized membrane protein YkoI
MPVFRHLPFVLLLGLFAAPAFAADPPPERSCLNKAEQRAAVASNRAIPLVQAIKTPRVRGKRAEMVRAQLCQRGDRLVYVLTLLSRSGKVTSTTVDAANGELINSR